MIVVDNSLLVYFWLPGDFTKQAEAAKEQDGTWAAPVVWRAEFRNVLAGYLRKKVLTEAEANAAYLNAQKDLGAHEFTVLKPSESSSWCWPRIAPPMTVSTSRWHKIWMCRW